MCTSNTLCRTAKTKTVLLFKIPICGKTINHDSSKYGMVEHRVRDTGGQGLITNDDMGTAQAVSRRDLPDHC